MKALLKDIYFLRDSFVIQHKISKAKNYNQELILCEPNIESVNSMIKK